MEKSISGYPERKVYLFLFAVTLFMRFPFFFRDYINWDESTFILIGESVSEGNLPYIELWDLKPPLVFYIFGVVQKLFPDSLVAIRFMGVLFIFFSAVLIVKISRKCSFNNGILSALVFILLSTQYEYLQGVSSEHLAVFFALLGIYFFVYADNGLFYFLSGAAFGLALMCKLNYAYPLFFLFIIAGINRIINKDWENVFRKEICTGFGILSAIFLISLPYIIRNEAALFFESVFLASFEYGHKANIPFPEFLGKAWILLFVSMFVAIAAMIKRNHEQRVSIVVLVVFLMGTMFTFVLADNSNGHYRILLLPFILILFFGVIIKKEFSFRLPYFALLFLILSYQSVYEYYSLLNNYLSNGQLKNGKAYAVLNELKKRRLEGKQIFFTKYHICYWFLDKKPLAKSVTHPSNLTRPYLFKYFDNPAQTSLDEFFRIMETIRPEVVVSGSDELVFKEGTYEATVVSTYLVKNFDIVYENREDETQIWKRKK